MLRGLTLAEIVVDAGVRGGKALATQSSLESLIVEPDEWAIRQSREVDTRLV
jgi:hypothetical protein